MSDDATDVLIVGSGAAGSLLAAKLVAIGKQVLILEAGPERKLDDLISSQIWARRLKWGGSPVESLGTPPISNALNSGFGTGGSALHHYACWPRLHENDFKMRSDHGCGLDWPIDYTDLQPYYDQVQAEVGISGDAEAEIWRPPGAPYPMPAVPVFAQGALLKRGFDRLGLHTAPIPFAINTQPYNGRPACLYDGWCDAGCPIGALANPLVTYLADALQAGAEIRHSATVTRILTNETGSRVTGALYVDKKGTQRRVTASLVILAAFTVQTPRLLLLSANEKHPKGLANASGQVGKYLSAHLTGNIYGMFSERTDCYIGLNSGQLMCQDPYDPKAREAGFGSYVWYIAKSMKPNDLLGIVSTRPELSGQALHGFIQRGVRHLGIMNSLVEDLPLAENEVTLSSTKDSLGLPVAKIRHQQSPQTQAIWMQSLEEGEKIMRAAGAKEVWHPGNPGKIHLMGGTIMGDDFATSVTDSYGRAHELPNLFIAGAGLFPTAGAVNPTFTLLALATRTADHIAKHWPQHTA